MKKFTVLFSLLIIGINLFGQEIHSSAEILKIMEKSKMTYALEVVESDVLTPDRSKDLNYNFYYRVEKGGEISTLEYEPNEESKEPKKKAEKFFKDGNYVKAREMYLKVLEVDPAFCQVMTYIGQTYGIEKNWEKAIEWYQKTIEKNYIDYMAHWFLADAYAEIGEWDKAVDEITIAQILNRNNPRIKQSMEIIYKKKKLKTESILQGILFLQL